MDEASRPSALADFPVVIELAIQWGDLDAYGHVNNLVYLKWCEAARAVYATKVGVSILPGQGGAGAVVAGITCKYLRPVAYPGYVFAGVRVSRMSLGGVQLEFRITDGPLGIPVAEGTCDVVLYDYVRQVPVPIPDQIRTAVEALEGRKFDP